MRPLLPNFWKERRDAMGLGDRGKNQVKKGSPSGLFARTEPGITEIQTSSNTQIQNPINTGIQEPLPEKMTRGKCTTYLGHCRNVFASMLSMNAGRKWTSCGKHWTTGSRNRDIEEDACCRRHTSNAVSQTVEARCCPPETSNTGQRGVRRLPKRRY